MNKKYEEEKNQVHEEGIHKKETHKERKRKTKMGNMSNHDLRNALHGKP